MDDGKHATDRNRASRREDTGESPRDIAARLVARARADPPDWRTKPERAIVYQDDTIRALTNALIAVRAEAFKRAAEIARDMSNKFRIRAIAEASYADGEAAIATMRQALAAQDVQFAIESRAAKEA